MVYLIVLLRHKSHLGRTNSTFCSVPDTRSSLSKKPLDFMILWCYSDLTKFMSKHSQVCVSHVKAGHVFHMERGVDS